MPAGINLSCELVACKLKMVQVIYIYIPGWVCVSSARKTAKMQVNIITMLILAHR